MAIAGSVAVLFIVIASIMQEEPPDPYKGGPRTPERVRRDIQQINSSVMLNCMKKGLNDSEWTCPRVTQDQTMLIMTRLMTNYAEYKDATVRGVNNGKPAGINHLARWAAPEPWLEIDR